MNRRSQKFLANTLHFYIIEPSVSFLKLFTTTFFTFVIRPLLFIIQKYVDYKICAPSLRYVNSPALSGCHLHFVTLTRMKISASFYPHYRCFTRILYLSSKKISSPLPKKTRKNKNKALFKEKKAPGKTLLYQQSLEHLTTLCMTSSTFTFFLCLSIISSFCIVYNRGTRLAPACFDTPSWWWHLVNENVARSIYALAGKKMKSTLVGVQKSHGEKKNLR